MNNTLFVGKVFLNFDTLFSTNEYAIDLLSKSKPSEGTVISAHHQTAGRGQYGSRWYSEGGKAITLSVILRPIFLNISQQFDLNIAVALAVFDFVCINATDVDLHVKWPNDIYIGNKKLGGILIQNSISNRKIASSVVGIGLNVNQLHFSPELPNPTSLLLETKHEFDIRKLIEDLCLSLEVRYLQLKAGKIEALRNDYYQILYKFQIPTKYERAGGNQFVGIITGISPEGRLCVQNERGVIEVFGLKEIKILL